MNDSPKKIRRLAISLRGLLLLVLIVGLVLGWRIQRARDQKRVVEALRKDHVQLRYDWEFVDGLYVPNHKPPGPEWLRRRLGDEYFQEVVTVHIAAMLPQRSIWDRENVPPGKEAEAAIKLDRILETLGSLTHLRTLSISGLQLSDAHLTRIRALPTVETLSIDRATNLTEAGFADLAGQDHLKTLAIVDGNHSDACVDRIAEIASLEELDLRSGRITDAHLDRLARLPRLRLLSLGGGYNEITDDGMAKIRGVKTLEYVNIELTKVNDAGLMILADLPGLKEVWLFRSRVTPEGIKQFQSRRPDVRVNTVPGRFVPPLRLRYP